MLLHKRLSALRALKASSVNGNCPMTTGLPAWRPHDPRLITIPYAAGVALGVAVFYALPSSKATTPLEVKLTEYQSDMEQTEARDID